MQPTFGYNNDVKGIIIVTEEKQEVSLIFGSLILCFND